MKSLHLFIYLLLCSSLVFAQKQSYVNRVPKTLQKNGLQFSVDDLNINTELTEIGAGFFSDKYLILSNKKWSFATITIDPNTNIPNNNVYCADIDKSGNLSRPIILSKSLDAITNEGGVTFSPDQKTIYLTRAKDSNSKQYSLYKATLDLKVKGFWKDLEELSINGDYSVETPFMSPDGKKIYFSSDKEGGFGGFDLYSADVLDDGTLTNVVNLGPTVNSAKDEKYPYASKDSKYLYFSSNGHETFGSYDVFRVSLANNDFVNRSNLGETINTVNDEIAFIFYKTNKGYVSSNRKANKSDFDIYKFGLETPKKQNFNASVSETETKTPLPNAQIVIKDEFGQIVKKLTSDNNGIISVKISPLTAYTIVTTKEGYEPNTFHFRPDGNRAQYNSNIALNQLEAKVTDTAIEIENIYFDFDKAIIKKESELSLNKIVAVLNTHPEMKIRINAHTDSKGKADYNMMLSEKRAKSAYDYLVTHGITQDRLTYKGFGKTQLKFKCTECTEEENSKNRRVEFMIQQ